MKTDGPVGTDRRYRVPFAIAAVLVGGWLCFLATLAVLEANPVTVNREQILSSDAVVVAVEARRKKDTTSFEVKRVLAGRNVPETLLLTDFELRSGGRDRKLVIPLRRTSGGYEITPGPEALDGKRLVYPLSAETLDAVTKILATGDEQPYE